MRLLYLLAAFLLPFAGFAQDDFVQGTYELVDGTKAAGLLNFQPGFHSKLFVKAPAADPTSREGKKGKEYSPEQVRSFDLGSDHYVLMHSILLNAGMNHATKNDDFAKVLETGKLELLHYQFSYVDLGIPNAAGIRYNTRNRMMVYLLRLPGEDKATMVPLGRNYKEMLATFLSSRPDLVKKLDVPPKSPAEFFPMIRSLVQEFNAK